MATILTTVAKWIKQAKIFHMQKMCILALREGRLPFSSHSSTPQTTTDPNAMDVNAITLSKLTPTERAKCIHEGRCFHCRLPRHNASQCKKDKSPHLQSIHSTKTNPSPSTSPPVETRTSSPINAFVNSLKTQGKDKAKILQILQMCFEEPREEIAVVFPLTRIFKSGSHLDVTFPIPIPCISSL